ncbi:hypothetical protein MJO28_010300 [Puccinia striiformis f. sp. tritici]|uniref:Uncharacterized protein n=2 Tax=Puccinia striiformis TaxID=27350 RepID=A0A2S4VWS7_9BASI|nr:hypothetical protein MJO28_010300 [Puccinia striiformis f. sp. tritici]POW13939.1 hypothetical protein PSTT_03379 [Puccinia striiformis]
MVNLFLTTSFILRIAFLQATSPHGITFPEPPSAVHNLEAGQASVAHDHSLEIPHMQVPDFTSMIPSSANGPEVRGDHYPAPDLAPDDEFIDWAKLPLDFDIMGSWSTVASASEQRPPSEYQSFPHLSTTPSAELTVEDYATLGLVESAVDYEQVNWGSLPFHCGSPPSLPTMLNNLNYVNSIPLSKSLGLSKAFRSALNEAEVEILMIGEYTAVSSWPTNLIGEPVSNSLSRSRKKLGNLEGSPSKQSKTSHRISDGNDGEITTNHQSSVTPKDLFSTRQRQDFLQAPQRIVVDMFELDLKIYGMLNTLRFPGPKKWTCKLFTQNLLHQSELWKSLRGDGNDFALPVLIREVIHSRVVPKESVLENARNFLEEIFFRHGQILIAFTYSETQNKGEIDGPIELRSKEQGKLLKWLNKLFNLRVITQGLHVSNKDYSTVFPPSVSPLQEMLSNYLNQDVKKSVYLETRFTKKSLEQWKLNHSDAMRTQVAINALGNHYKYSNLIRWLEIFQRDDYFVKIFILLKRKECTGNLPAIKDDLISWTTLGVFPWENTESLQNCPEKKSILTQFQYRMHKETWLSLNRYFEEVKEIDKCDPATGKHKPKATENVMFIKRPFLQK